MGTLMDLFLITIIVVVIVDLSGFTDSWKSLLKRIMTKGMMSSPDFRFKPFDCSLCMSHHIGLIYLICTSHCNLNNYAILLIFCFMTPVVKDLLILIKDILTKLIGKVYEEI